MTTQTQLESHHGVLVRISDYGVLIIGPAGIGKSSLALELISQGHQLIADDVVEISKRSNVLIGHCPPMLEGLLHTRELGLISIPDVFGEKAWKKQQRIDVVISLQTSIQLPIELTRKTTVFTLLEHALPCITLSTSNPASLVNRIQCWLTMQTLQSQPETMLQQRQQSFISNFTNREQP